MSENQNNEQIEELLSNVELISKLEQMEETKEFINDCNASIFDNTNDSIVIPKEKNIKKKYRLLQYYLYINDYVYIDKFATFSEINTYLTSLNIHINLKSLIKNKLFKIELII
jgi:hypothetical protein